MASPRCTLQRASAAPAPLRCTLQRGCATPANPSAVCVRGRSRAADPGLPVGKTVRAKVVAANDAGEAGESPVGEAGIT